MVLEFTVQFSEKVTAELLNLPKPPPDPDAHVLEAGKLALRLGININQYKDAYPKVSLQPFKLTF